MFLYVISLLQKTTQIASRHTSVYRIKSPSVVQQLIGNTDNKGPLFTPMCL